MSHIAAVVLAESGLAGDDFAEGLSLVQQFFHQGAFVLQRRFALLRLEVGDQFVPFGVERSDLNDVCRQRRQALHGVEQRGFQGADLRLEFRSLHRLAKNGVDLDQIGQGFQVPAQGQTAPQQLKAFQLGTGTDQLVIRITHQIKIGDQHGQEKQDADEGELHREAQTVHQRDCRVQKALHKKSPFSFIFIGCSESSK